MDPEAERKLATYDAKRRRIEKFVFAALVFVLALLLVIENLVFDFRGSLPLPFNLLFFILINVNVILIFLLLFLVFRNLAKLIFERRAGVLGSRLRTKLIVAFASFALIPTVAFFYVAVSFITNSMERWFSIQVESSLSESLEVAQTFYKAYENSAQFFAEQMADGMVRQTGEGDLTSALAGVDLEGYLRERRAEYNIDAVDLYLDDKSQSGFTAGLKRQTRGLTREQGDLLKRAWQGQAGSDTFEQATGEMVWGIAPVKNHDTVLGVVVVRYRIPESLLGRMRNILTAYEEYTQLQVIEDPIKTSYVVILALITCFIFFGAIWFGFLLSRNMVGPIQELAEGTKQVAQGDLDVVIRSRSTDELGVLVANFNTMTERLAEGRRAVEQAARELQESNVELERRRTYMETVLANISAGVVSFDENGKISTINESARSILGLSDTNPMGLSFSKLFGGRFDQQVENVMDALRRNPERPVVRQVELEAAGRTRNLLFSLSQIRDENRRDAGTVLVLEDLSELVKAQRMAAWQEVARKIAHEIKNPLTPIQLAAQRLRKRYQGRFAPDDKVFRESTATIIRQVDELKNMVDEFSNFARMAEPRPAMHNANTILNEAVILYSEAHKKIRFHFDTVDDLPPLLCDRDQLKRVFINLIDNAVASIEGAGNVWLSSRLDEQEKRVVFEIADDGCGLPSGYKGRLFEPYFSTRKMGTGLGLAIVHQIVTDMAGAIRLEDNAPAGTRVRIDLPIQSA